MRHMLRTPRVSNRLLPYGSIIIRILPYFRVHFGEPIYEESKKLGEEDITALWFHIKNGELVKNTYTKN